MIGGEKDQIFFFNVNVDYTPIVYDHYENNNYMTFGPSDENEINHDPEFTVFFIDKIK